MKMKANDFIIRSEKKEDYEQIALIHIGAFRHDLEANIIENLRKDSHYDKDLSLVAEMNGKIVGHILFSRISIENSYESYQAVVLAPLAVDNQYRGIGIGSKLVQAGIEVAKAKGFKLMLVSGHSYYDKFGFQCTKQIFRPNPVLEKHIRVLELEEGAGQGVVGVIKYPKAFKPSISEWEK